MRILLCGSRKWTDEILIRDFLNKLKENHEEVKSLLQHYPGYPDLVIIEGEAKGADRIARQEALKIPGIIVMRYPAEWSKYGKRAGPIRNQQMLDDGKPDAVVAFTDDPEGTPHSGTWDMIDRAKKAGLPYKVITHHVKVAADLSESHKQARLRSQKTAIDTSYEPPNHY